MNAYLFDKSIKLLIVFKKDTVNCVAIGFNLSRMKSCSSQLIISFTEKNEHASVKNVTVDGSYHGVKALA